jgi:hypothetical protein
MTARSRATEVLIGIHPKRHLAWMEGILALFDIHWAISPIGWWPSFRRDRPARNPPLPLTILLHCKKSLETRLRQAQEGIRSRSLRHDIFAPHPARPGIAEQGQ